MEQSSFSKTTTATMTTSSSSYFSSSEGFDEFFSTPFLTDAPQTPFLSNIGRDTHMVLHRSSPSYEVTENSQKFQLAMSIPGVKPNDLEVCLEHGGRVLKISGGRKIQRLLSHDNGITCTESRFEKRFILHPSIDVMRISADLQNGILCITAPKVGCGVEGGTVRKIPIMAGPTRGLITEGREEQEE